MKNYFSRLVTQTGIGRARSRDSYPLGGSLTGKPLYKDVTASLEIVDERELFPQESITSDKTNTPVIESASQSEPSSRREEPPSERRSKSGPTPELRPSSRPSETGLERDSTKQAVKKSGDRLVQPQPRRESTKLEITSVRAITNVESKIESGTPSPFPKQRKTQEVVQSSIALKTADLNEQTLSEIPTRTPLKTVAEPAWQPPARPAEETDVIEGLPSISQRTTAPSSLEIQHLSSHQAEERKEKTPSPEPEIQDFHITIGTISLNVEAPQDKPIHFTPPKATLDEGSGSQADSSRVRRHYLRVR